MSPGGDSLKERLDEAWEALDSGEIEEGLARARGLLAMSPGEPEVLHLAGSAMMDAGDLEGAEPLLRQALERSPTLLDARGALALLLYETCRFDEAREEVERILAADEKDPQAHHLASRLAEHRGDEVRAEEEARMAHRMEPEAFPLPTRFTRSEFEGCVESAIAELPRKFRDRMENLAVLVEDLPSEAVLALLEDPSPEILGLFVGTPLPEKHLGEIPRPPDAIYLFKKNLERVSESREILVEEIRITLLHEVGHFLGLDEDQIADRGFG